MVLYGAARRSRVRRLVGLNHTFVYAVLLGVVAFAVNETVLRGVLVALGALMMWYSALSWRGLHKPANGVISTFRDAAVYVAVVVWDVFAAPVGLIAALVLSSVAGGAWAFALLVLWDGLGTVLRFFLRAPR